MLFRRIPAGRITPGLERLDLLKPEDRAALTVYTETWSTYVAAMVRIRAECLTLVNPDSGHTSAHPCVVIAHSAGQQLLRYSSYCATAASWACPRSPSASWAASRLTTTSTARSAAASTQNNATRCNYATRPTAR